MERVGIRVEKQHHEVATAGQAEIDMRFLPLVKMGDALMWYKYIVKNVARRTARRRRSCRSRSLSTTAAACTPTSAIWKGEKPLFAGDGYGGMSELGMHYIGGILKHAPALAAFTNPGTNSYRRLVPGFEAPVNLAYSSAQPLSCRAHPDVLALARRRSASRSASPIRPATATSPLRRC